MRRYFRGWRFARSWAADQSQRVGVNQVPNPCRSSFTSEATKIYKRFWTSIYNNPTPLPKERLRNTIGKVEVRHNYSGGSSLGRSRSLGALNASSTTRFAGIREAAHQLFVNNVLRRVANSQANELRRKTAKQLFGGNATPFFALVGVSLASGNGKIQSNVDVHCTE